MVLEGRGRATPEAWFLGPKAENATLLRRLIAEAISEHCKYRRGFQPSDPEFITRKVKDSPEYKRAVEDLTENAGDLFTALKKSAPFFSARYQGHMLWDQALPATVGYFAAMLYNQNNVAAEASPVTTLLEIRVADELCRMLGFALGSVPGQAGPVRPWGHITCDGSVANIEALWAARNAKFLPVALRAALLDDPNLKRAVPLQVKLPDGRSDQLTKLDTWSLLNVEIDEVVNLVPKMSDLYGVSLDETTTSLAQYAVQSVGLIDFYQRFISDSAAQAPVAMVPASSHYSWPKAGALLGLGRSNILDIAVDLQARMDITRLKERLEECLQNRIPVIAVVAVIGSTEEGAVDPLRKIIELRTEFRKQGLDFAIHCDAAWGGYVTSMLHTPADTSLGPLEPRAKVVQAVPEYPLSPYVEEQCLALADTDSITLDPHKAGYVPYPAGSVCYRNAAMRDLISLSAPVVYRSTLEPTVGIYGVEGSKPGAAAAAVWLAHKVIRPDSQGYGKILGQCLWTSKRLYCRLVTMTDKRFTIGLFQMLPAERDRRPPGEVQRQKEYIRKEFVLASNDDLTTLLNKDDKAGRMFAELGSDLLILGYSFNFFGIDGTLNNDADKMNCLNDKVFEICSITEPIPNLNSKRLIVTSSRFDPAVYGQAFVDDYAFRVMGTKPPQGVPIHFLISTTMGPWATAAGRDGRSNLDGFLEEVEEALREAASTALGRLGY